MTEDEAERNRQDYEEQDREALFEDLSRGPGDFDMRPGRFIGVDPPEIVHSFDYSIIARGANYPWDENIDYDPRTDEDLEDHHATE